MPHKARISFWFARLLFAGVLVFEGLNWIGALHNKPDFTWGGLMLTAIFVWICMELVNYWLIRRTGIGLPWFAVIMSVVSLYIDALGDMLHFYSRFVWYDQVAHFFGGAAVGLLLLAVTWRLTSNGKKWDWIIGFCVISGTAFFAALYEIEEYLEDYWTGSHRLGDGPDTANDMMLGILGATVVVGVLAVWRRMEKN